MAESPERPARPLASLGLRLLAAAVLVPLVIFLAYRGGWLFALAVSLWALRLLYEYAQMARGRGHQQLFATLAFMSVVIMALSKVVGASAAFAAFTLFALGLCAHESLRGRIEGATSRVAEKLLALFYLGLLPAHWILLRELPEQLGLGPGVYVAGGELILFCAGITWLGDTFAYILGSLFGRRRLGSAVSPNKTLEGVVGGLLGSVLVAWLLAPYWARFLALWEVLLLGTLLSVVGQMGDLFESLLKRDAAIKDSGTLIPGHGGFLDRVDSALFTIPLLYYFMLFYKSRGGSIF